MKNQYYSFLLLGLTALFAAACQTSSSTQVKEYDSVYFTAKDKVIPVATRSERQSNTYERDDDFTYSRRIRRFNNASASNWRYYDPYYSNDLYYAMGTPSWGSWYGNGWYNFNSPWIGTPYGMGMGYSPWYNPWNSYGYGFYNPYWNMGCNPWMNTYYGNSYYSGYNWGYGGYYNSGYMGGGSFASQPKNVMVNHGTSTLSPAHSYTPSVDQKPGRIAQQQQPVKYLTPRSETEYTAPPRVWTPSQSVGSPTRPSATTPNIKPQTTRPTLSNPRTVESVRPQTTRPTNVDRPRTNTNFSSPSPRTSSPSSGSSGGSRPSSGGGSPRRN